MTYTLLQIEAIGYIFEKENGNTHSDFEDNMILESDLQNISILELEKELIDECNSNKHLDSKLRENIYWALSKRFNKKLVPTFKKWLLIELKQQNNNHLFQLMIALDNLEEPIFGKNRTSYSAHDNELNRKDATSYLGFDFTENTPPHNPSKGQ